MKKISLIAIALFVTLISNVSYAQDAQTIKLVQVDADFTTKGITLSEGNYVFEITNDGVDHEVGFVVAPKGKTDQAHHIKEAYVQKTAKNGETSSSKVVKLTKGEYVYFCPLNPTPQYTITVK